MSGLTLALRAFTYIFLGKAIDSAFKHNDPVSATLLIFTAILVTVLFILANEEAT